MALLAPVSYNMYHVRHALAYDKWDDSQSNGLATAAVQFHVLYSHELSKEDPLDLCALFRALRRGVTLSVILAMNSIGKYEDLSIGPTASWS